MSRTPSSIMGEIADAMKALEEALSDEEKRKEVDKFLRRFSEIKREEFIKRYTSLARYIEEICGENTAGILFRMVSQSLPDIKKFLEQVKDENVRKWLSQLNSKYISVFEGAFPPIMHDWYRVLWTVKIDFTHGGIPLIEATILKRNGESLYLEVPFPSMVTLVNHILRQICETKEVNIREIPGIAEELQQTKRIIEPVLESEA